MYQTPNSTSPEYELQTEIEVKQFKHYDMKTNRAISRIDMNFSKATNVEFNGNESI